MKKLTVFLLLTIAFQKVIAQEIDQCRTIVQITTEGINDKSPKKLETYLSPEFTIAGQQGEVAKMVLNQLFSQLGETVLTYEELSAVKKDNELEFKYNIEYEKMGTKEGTFVFDKNNLLKELELFKMEVKTMSENSKVEKPKQKVLNIPFTMAGNLIAVDVVLDGIKRKFILDTGAPKAILNSKYLSKKATEQQTISSSQGVNGNISGMDITEVNQLDFGGIQLRNQEIITIDLSHLEESLETEIYGLIGFEMVKDYDLIFDYKNQILTLISPEHFANYKKENLSNKELSTVKIALEGHIPVVQVKIDDTVLNVGIDSGAESNLIDDDLFDNLKKYLNKIESEQLIGADNNPKKVKKGQIKKLQIGERILKKQTTLFSDISHLNEGYKLNLDGLIGYPVLSKQKTLISFERKEMTFIN